jgi:hypothetical protein
MLTLALFSWRRKDRERALPFFRWLSGLMHKHQLDVGGQKVAYSLPSF